MSREGKEGGGSGVGGCGSNMIIGQEGRVAVCRGGGGRRIILGVGDRGWVTEGWGGLQRSGGGLSAFPLNGWSVCGGVGVRVCSCEGGNCCVFGAEVW